MKKWAIVVGLGALTFAAVAQNVFAGTKFSNPVQVNTGIKMASGSLGSARSSSDGNQYVGCWVNSDSGSGWGSCSARSSNGTQASCYTSNSNMLATMRSLQADGSVTFYWDAQGACTMVYAETYSYNTPKTP